MYVYYASGKKIFETAGGYTDIGCPITDIYTAIKGAKFNPSHNILYRPSAKRDRKNVGIVFIHSDDDYSTMNAGGEMAKRGYTVLAGQVNDPNELFDQKILDIKNAVDFLRTLDGIEKVIVFGHSGGATLMSAYQAIAENGASVFQGNHMLYSCEVAEALHPADAVALFDSNWGNASMTILSTDPAVIEEGNGIKANPKYNPFSPESGYAPGATKYTEEFKKTYFEKQRERNNALVKKALDRLTLINNGKGNYVDDEPFIVTAGAQIKPCNRLIPQDIHLLAHTKFPHTLLRKDGSAITEIINCVRNVEDFGNKTPFNGVSTLVTTVRHFLGERAAFAGDDYGVHEDCITGIQWENTYNCTPGNVRFINAPVIIMGMTGSYEYLASEIIYNNCASSNKELYFMEGAGHNFDPISEKYFDSEKVVYDKLAEWIDRVL